MNVIEMLEIGAAAIDLPLDITYTDGEAILLHRSVARMCVNWCHEMRPTQYRCKKQWFYLFSTFHFE
jgi:hypothetical protein